MASGYDKNISETLWNKGIILSVSKGIKEALNHQNAIYLLVR